MKKRIGLLLGVIVLFSMLSIGCYLPQSVLKDFNTAFANPTPANLEVIGVTGGVEKNNELYLYEFGGAEIKKIFDAIDCRATC